MSPWSPFLYPPKFGGTQIFNGCRVISNANLCRKRITKTQIFETNRPYEDNTTEVQYHGPDFQTKWVKYILPQGGRLAFCAGGHAKKSTTEEENSASKLHWISYLHRFTVLSCLYYIAILSSEIFILLTDWMDKMGRCGKVIFSLDVTKGRSPSWSSSIAASLAGPLRKHYWG